VTLSQFEEIVLVDFEFNGGEGTRPNVVCLVAYELRSGRRFRLWRDELGPEPPYRVDARTLFVAYYASAELTCHLALGWPMPANILDLFIEYRNLTNHSNEVQPAAGLLDALDRFRLDSISLQTKKHWRDVVLRGGPWTAEERAGILEYCETDVEALERLLRVFPLANLDYALIHGAYMRADAWMRHWGVPIDLPLFAEMSANWTELRRALIDDLNARYPFFEGETFKVKLLEQWVIQQGIVFWPRTPTGLRCTDTETLEMIAKRCPAAAEFCTSKITLNQLKTFELSVDDDGRNRCMLSAYRSKTSRNQPSNSAFVFGLNAAYRSLIKPESGRALAYLDFSGQEFAIAAYSSGDRNMIAAYESGDPYSDWARRANAMPTGGDKFSHPHVRAAYKRASLGVLYGMKAATLSGYVGVSFVRARSILQSHKEAFPRFWQWSEAVQDAGIIQHELQTVFGWRMRVLPGAKPGTLANFPMQANGAEMPRLACCFAVNRGIHIIAPVHDAILVEGPAEDIDDIVRDLSKCMVEASRAVLGGPVVRVDASKPLVFPHRYVDGRDGSGDLWATTMMLLDRLKRRTA
jgi:DNA polymerase I